MGGKSQSGPSSMDKQVYQQFSDAGSSGVGYYYGGDPKYEEAAQQGYLAGEASRPAEMPDFSSMFANSQPDYDAIARSNAEAQAEAERVAGVGQVNQLYSSKFAAANAATEGVNTKMAEELGYARVGGADYNVTAEQKAERINNAFAGLWSSEQESQLADLEGKWGSADNAWTSGIVRGLTPEDNSDAGEEGDSAGSSVGAKRVLGASEEEEEETIGGATATLGSI